MSVMKRNAERMVELEDFWLNVTLEELMAWSLRELRVALASRDLDQIGTRAQLIDRILQQQRRDLKRVARAEALEKLQRERRGEAKGSVIASAWVRARQHWLGPALRSAVPSVMQALCGRVVQVTCSFDARVAACLTESGRRRVPSVDALLTSRPRWGTPTPSRAVRGATGGRSSS
ncbi:hypothetical protein FNF31_02419 [Cafeteria roenbergensis]|uniref:SAP domain-containing protein n=1 Tax=Cafeteria roenbergensis TaxID=33653 RepID=A0A5A8DF93_CAFRO|nr:hypothetical protein FNF31_02419 [Cafeteria roenbergensis]